MEQTDSALASAVAAPARALPRWLAAVWPYVLVAAVGCLILLPKLGEFGFWDPWEPKYGETVREMIERDSFWVPYYRDDVRLAKPILVYWGILAGASVFGLNEFGARIVGVGFAIAALLGVLYAVSLLRGRRAGLISALVLASSPHFFLIARQAMPDVYLFTSVGMCLMFFALGLYGGEPRRDLHFAVAYACFGLAVLAKGPIVAGAIVGGAIALLALAHLDPRSLGVTLGTLALLGAGTLSAALALVLSGLGGPESIPGKLRGRLADLPVAANGWTFPVAALAALVLLGGGIAAARWFLRQPHVQPLARRLTRPILRQVGIFAVVFAVVAGPWHVAIVLQQGMQYFTYFIVKHNLQRATDQVNQSGTAEFYARVVTFGLFPWSAWVPVALASLVGFGERRRPAERGLETFLLLACAAGIGAFSLSVTKFAHYLAPLVIPLAVLVGLTLERTLAEGSAALSRLAWIGAALLFVLPATDLARSYGSMFLVESFTIKRFVPDDLSLGALYYALMLATGVILLAGAVLRSRILVGALCACAVAMAWQANAVFIPALTPQKTMRNLCETWKREASAGQPIGFYGDLKHGIYFYTDYRVTRLLGRPAFLKFMEPTGAAYCIIERKEIPDLEAEYRTTYPGFGLEAVDDSHFDYQLVRPAPLAEGRQEQP